MAVIYKFGPFEPGESYLVKCSHPLHFGYQGRDLFLWGYPGETEEGVAIYGTGWEIPDDQYYVGTAVSTGGYVWHCYIYTP